MLYKYRSMYNYLRKSTVHTERKKCLKKLSHFGIFTIYI